MNLKKRIFLLFIFFFINNHFIYTQNAISFSLYQDLKLLAFDDEHGNKAGTLDLITQLKYEHKESNLGFWTAGIEFEKANIKDGYIRYGGILGYTFTAFFDDSNLHVSPSIGFGNIIRHSISSPSWSSSIQTYYKLNELLKITSLIQFTERSDLEIAFGDKVTRFSFFIGLSLNLFRFKR